MGIYKKTNNLNKLVPNPVTKFGNTLQAFVLKSETEQRILWTPTFFLDTVAYRPVASQRSRNKRDNSLCYTTR
jgi:hypothetical protein